MNKRGLIKYILVFIAVIISIYFIVTNEASSGSVILLMSVNFFPALTIFMFCNKNKVKNNKFIYDVLLILLMIFTVLWFLYFSYAELNCYFSKNCTIETETMFKAIYPMLIFLMLLFSYSDIYNKTNKTNDILTIIVSILIIFIYIRYYFEPNMLIENNQYNYYYVVQNYIYFSIMYLIVLIHRAVNKKI